jgi:molybdate transport system substrate-binding protein
LKRTVVTALAVLALVTTLVFEWACQHATDQPAELTVAAASDLTQAFEELGREFEATNKTKVVFVFGSTGMLTRQIENGAPMDLFAAANVEDRNHRRSQAAWRQTNRDR